MRASQEQTPIVVPFDVVLSLLKPDELEKLWKYIFAYLNEYSFDNEQKNMQPPLRSGLHTHWSGRDTEQGD